MVKIKFTKFGANSAIGGFAPGDTMRCGEAMAQHFVDTDVAQYAETPVVVEPPAPAKRTKAK